MTFRFWTAWPAAPFMRLSMATTTITRWARSSTRGKDAAVVGADHVLELGRLVDEGHERLAGVGLVVESAQSGRRRPAGDAHVDRLDDAARTGMR